MQPWRYAQTCNLTRTSFLKQAVGIRKRQGSLWGAFSCLHWLQHKKVKKFGQWDFSAQGWMHVMQWIMKSYGFIYFAVPTWTQPNFMQVWALIPYVQNGWKSLVIKLHALTTTEKHWSNWQMTTPHWESHGETAYPGWSHVPSAVRLISRYLGTWYLLEVS